MEYGTAITFISIIVEITSYEQALSKHSKCICGLLKSKAICTQTIGARKHDLNIESSFHFSSMKGLILRKVKPLSILIFSANLLMGKCSQVQKAHKM